MKLIYEKFTVKIPKKKKKKKKIGKNRVLHIKRQNQFN